MRSLKKFLILGILFLFTLLVQGQRTYKPNSVLANGNWYKLSVTSEGVHRMDAAFFNTLGINGNIPSAAIRVFGNEGGMLPEANNSSRIDDLEEISIVVVDGGDGIFNGSDHILFFTPGSHQWIKDSANKRFIHKKNLYSDKSFYFLTIQGNGKRIPSQTTSPSPSASVSSFDERYFHELDTVNFLSSGREWFGEEFSSSPGRTLSRSFNLSLVDIVPNSSATIITNAAARSVNVTSRFNVSVNNQVIQQLNILPVGAGSLDLFAQQLQQVNSFSLNQNPTVNYTYVPGSFNSQGWLNWFEFFCRRNLILPASQQLLFRDWNSTGMSSAEFLIANANASSQVWDVTDPLNVVRINSSLTGTQLRFSNEALRLREYAAFSGNFLTPKAEGRVLNQNLHNTTEKDYLIITHAQFLSQAQRLAAFHQQRNNLRSIVITTEQVFNEFSGGIPDPTAIRDFVKMYYDRYRTNWSQSGKYLLLFGKASFDYKERIKNNTNYIPSYESISSLDPLSTYTSDDYFGFLDDNEDINSGLIINTLDIGIGRVPAKTLDEAKNFVDKVAAYYSAASFGSWRNNLNFIADDEDFNLHLQDAEVLTATTAAVAPIFNQQKIYLDAFQQEGGSAGEATLRQMQLSIVIFTMAL